MKEENLNLNNTLGLFDLKKEVFIEVLFQWAHVL